jgi:outer membrane protein assembly factor BamD (BamD/ComL family)
MNTSPNDSSNLVTFASGELLAEQRNFKGALEKYKIVAGDQNKFMLQNLAIFREGEMELAMNNLDSAKTVFQKIANEDQKNIYADKALYLLGKIYQFGLKDKAKATETYENLLAKFPNSLYLDNARAEIIKLRDNKIDRIE